jgi:hypothetical protein
MEGKPRADDGELPSFVRQGQHVALLPGEIVEALLLLRSPGLLEHGRSQIDAGGMPHHAGERASQQPRPAGHIQQGILGAGFGHLHDAVEGLLIADGRSARKRRRLARELIPDEV